MASPMSGRAGRLASIAVGTQLQKTQDQIDQRIRTGQKNSLTALGNAYKGARAQYQAARDMYTPYAETGGRAFQQYADASGVNGQEGHDRAVANFRAGPGYQWQVDQATDAVARKASALGALGSGNTMAAITDRASHLADQEYDQYLGRLEGLGRVGYDATSRQAGITTALGDLRTQLGRDRVGVYQTGTGLGVNALARTGEGIAESLGKGMMAGQNAAANRWNMAMQGIQLGASLLGGAMGGGMGGSLVSGARSLFGGGGGTGQAEWPQAYAY